MFVRIGSVHLNKLFLFVSFMCQHMEFFAMEKEDNCFVPEISKSSWNDEEKLYIL